MNRIKQVGDSYFVLITPDYKSVADSNLLLGNMNDEELKNYYLLEYGNQNDAVAEALNYVDIDWYRMVLSHQFIYINLDKILRGIINDYKLNIEYKPVLLDAMTYKNVIFDRVMSGGDRVKLRYGSNEIITYTFISPFSSNLHYISRIIENYRNVTYRDDLRIRFKKIVDSKIIILYGYTDYGTVYSIKLIPNLLNEVVNWKNKRPNIDNKKFDMEYNKMLKLQSDIDNKGNVLL